MLLAIDTATRTISLALYDGHRVIAESSWLTANHHTIELTPSVAAMLGGAGLAPGDLRGVAVALGPGSFTGLRIGLGVAKGLALAVKAALIGVPTLDILAASQGPPPEDKRLCALLQAGRGRLAVAWYDWQGDSWSAAEEGFITTWTDLASHLAEKPTLVVGEVDASGLEALHDCVGVQIVRGSASLRRAGFLAELGWARLDRGETDDPATLAPTYLHQPRGSPP
jgi:tRNA threonylcarbamoyladenosine biosynthesis protein TsaB